MLKVIQLLNELTSICFRLMKTIICKIKSSVSQGERSVCI